MCPMLLSCPVQMKPSSWRSWRGWRLPEILAGGQPGNKWRKSKDVCALCPRLTPHSWGFAQQAAAGPDPWRAWALSLEGALLGGCELCAPVNEAMGSHMKSPPPPSKDWRTWELGSYPCPIAFQLQNPEENSSSVPPLSHL